MGVKAHESFDYLLKLYIDIIYKKFIIVYCVGGTPCTTHNTTYYETERGLSMARQSSLSCYVENERFWNHLKDDVNIVLFY